MARTPLILTRTQWRAVRVALKLTAVEDVMAAQTYATIRRQLEGNFTEAEKRELVKAALRTVSDKS